MLASPIDDEFLTTSFGTSLVEERLVALMTSEKNPQILASSNQVTLPIGTKLSVLEKDYSVTGTEFFCYGASELSTQFVSLAPLTEVKELTDSVISRERQSQLVTALVYIFSLAIIMFWITKRIQRLSKSVSAFSQSIIGVDQPNSFKGDQLDILEKRFQRLTDEILMTLKNLLQISLQDYSLDEILERFVGEVIAIPWLGVDPNAAIFLVDDDPETLVLTAHQNLPESLLVECAQVRFGQCLCGKAAQSGELVFVDCVDERHEKIYEGIVPHGHYCVPIKTSEDDRVLGVFTLFIKEGFRFDKAKEEFFLLAVAKLAGIIKRKQDEVALQKAHGQLEVRVEQRTMELATASYQS